MSRLFLAVHDDDFVKCPGCNWEVSRLYVLAKDQAEADQIYADEEGGLCGNCIANILVEEPYEITRKE